MRIVSSVVVVIALSSGIFGALPAAAIDGEVLITQQKALAGNVTPGDAPGFPVTLSRAGKYKLASYLSPSRGRGSLEVTADFVTIDLNGFPINGQGYGTLGIYGTAVSGTTIGNGTITNFNAGNSAAIYTLGKYWTVQNVQIFNSGAGIVGGAFCGFLIPLWSAAMGTALHVADHATLKERDSPQWRRLGDRRRSCNHERERDRQHDCR